MNFGSAIFLLGYLPLMVGGYLLFRRQWMLLVMSLVFVGWGSWTSLGWLGLISLWNYLLGKRVRGSRFWLWVGIGLNAGCLGLRVPGISFVVLAAISYLVEGYQGKSQAKFWQLGQYLSFFPKFLAGPVVKYGDLTASKITLEAVASGMQRFIFGLGKKLLLADGLAKGVAQIFLLPLEQLTPTLVWTGGLLFSMQIFLDFSGYTDMAIGLGQMLGYRLPENFNRPYAADSVRDFWRRWHMSFMTWLKTYVYIPLGGSRRGRWRQMINILIVFLLSGLWHGKGWTFLVWGAYFGGLVALERWTGWPRRGSLLSRGYTLAAIMLGWLWFRSESIEQAMAMTGYFFRVGEVSLSGMMALINGKMGLIWGLGVLMQIPVAVRFNRGVMRLISLGIYILCLMQMAASTYEPFLYAQF